MIDLTQYPELIVQQEVEHMEAFTGFETENRYRVSTALGEQILYAYEESGGMSRQFLGNHRPLTIHVVEAGSTPLLSASRSFFWFKSHLHISDASGRHVGSLHRALTFLGRRFDLEDEQGHYIAEVRGRSLRPNTFMVYDIQDKEVARITKEWSGFMREAFSDADTFHIQFHDESSDQDFRMLIIATAFAIDLDFFEKSSRGPD